MRRLLLKRALGLLTVGLIIAGAVWFAWPRPLPVDLAMVTQGPMEVTVEDEGKTRVRDVYTVSAPIAGRVLRTPRKVGDEVVADDTLVAVMRATEPAFLDLRSREELEAMLAAAVSAVELAEHEVHRIEAGLELAETELRRAETLAGREVVAAKTLDQAKAEFETNLHTLDGAKAQLAVRQSERASIAARLIEPSSDAAPADAAAVELSAPVSGQVLAIHQESEAVVQAGTPLLDIGNPRDLEIVADLLSTEAVQAEVGSPVRIDGWGGPPIRGRVARIDPAGFAKVSALGIEEQRVRTVIDLVDPPEAWLRLGHDFRVIVHITVWSADEAVTVPVSALFRRGDDWAVFTVTGSRARTAIVDIGRRNDRVAQVLGGLSPGYEVILHPSDRIAEGVSVAEREVR
jgi:HlyD family secretion protein